MEINSPSRTTQSFRWIAATGCGQGEMDYKPILKFVKEHKPFVHALLEETRPENSQRARHYMARMYEEV